MQTIHPISVLVHSSESKALSGGELYDFDEFEKLAYCAAYDHIRAGGFCVKTHITVMLENGQKLEKVRLDLGESCINFSDYVRGCIHRIEANSEQAAMPYAYGAAYALASYKQLGLNTCSLSHQREELSAARRAVEAEEQHRMQKLKRETKARHLASVEKLKNSSKYSHLTQYDGRQSARKIVVVNLRKELKRVFGGVKFSVRSGTGGAIYVRWTNGPTTELVDRICKKYQHGRFDGLNDSYEHHSTAWTVVFGSVDYVMTSRDVDEVLVQVAIENICRKYRKNTNGIRIPTGADYKQGRCYLLKIPGLSKDFQTLIYQELTTLDFSPQEQLDPIEVSSK